jgi:hypothetical protein
VAGGVDDLGRVAWQADHQAVIERLVRRCNRGCRNADSGRLFVHHGQQFKVVLVQQDGCAGNAFDLERPAHVVDVAVGDEDLLERKAKVGQSAVNAGNLVAGIDNDGFVSLLVAQDRAIALQRTDGEGLEDHGTIVLDHDPRPMTHESRTAATWKELDNLIRKQSRKGWVTHGDDHGTVPTRRCRLEVQKKLNAEPIANSYRIGINTRLKQIAVGLYEDEPRV